MPDCANPECAALRAELAELKRPHTPAEHGLGVRLTPTEAALVGALLPPGRPVHRDAIIAHAWPAWADAGLASEGAHLVRVVTSRVRTKLDGTGWRIPQAYGRGEYALLQPDMPLPPGFREVEGRGGGPSPAPLPPCPDCGGPKTLEARRCRPCEMARRAALAGRRTRGAASACPDCGGPKKSAARRCWDCLSARRAAVPTHGTCVDCAADIWKRATRCVPCEQARRRAEGARWRRHPWRAGLAS